MVAFLCPPPFMLVGGGAPFPVIEGSATSQQGDVSTSHIVTLPSGIQAGELLLIFAAIQSAGATTVNDISGWTKAIDFEQAGSTTGVSIVMYSRIATGSEGSTVTFTMSASRVSAHNSYRISGASGNIEHAVVGGASAAPNPPPLAPSWGSKNTLWLSSAAIRSGINGVISAPPADYDNLQNIVSGGLSSGVRVRMVSAFREMQAASEDPGSFTMSSSQDWAATTIGIEPA